MCIERRFRISITILFAFLAALVFPFLTVLAQSKISSLPTRPERTSYNETSRYDEVMTFLRAVAEASPRIHLTTFGYSFEGRPLPLAVVGSVKDARPESVLASGKIRVYIQGNIHAGEVEGKEALLMLLRSLAVGENAQWLTSMVLLIAPIYNADGNERVNLTNRQAQNGPIGGMGQRATAQNYDLNRDHMKLESPEARSLARLLTRYDPHLVIDLHTTNGTRHAYYLTYEPPLHPNTATSIVDLLRDSLLPAVTRAIKSHDGWDIYYYGNLPYRGAKAERGWYASGCLPRFNNHYVGLRNRLAILSEAYAYLTFHDRIRAQKRFVEEVLNFVQPHAAEVRKAIADAEKASVVGRELALRATYAPPAQAAEILMGDVAEERNPYTGAVMLRRLDVKKPELMPQYLTFIATETARAPSAYLVPATLDRVIERLEAHGVRSFKLETSAVLQLERFRIDSTTTADRQYQGHSERTLTGAWVPVEQTVPGGTTVIPVDQPLGRLVFSLLEPRSDDGFVAWNLMDDVLAKAEVYPVLRTFGELRISR